MVRKERKERREKTATAALSIWGGGDALESSIALTSTPHSSTSHSAHAVFFPATAKWSTLRPLPSLIAPTPMEDCFVASSPSPSPPPVASPRYFSAAALSPSKSPSLAAVRSIATCSLSARAAAAPEEEEESPPSSFALASREGQRAELSSPPSSLGSVTTTSPPLPAPLAPAPALDTLFETLEASMVP